MSPKVRAASHAGSWYTDNGTELDGSLTAWLKAVSPAKVPAPASVAATVAEGSESSSDVDLPIKGCRAIIGPHAGYSYSGPAAAWAYGCIDTAGIERVFILGPSHHVYLDGCALSKCDEYETPLGNLVIDKDMTAELASTGEFSTMSQSVDEDEHSLEMHLPYVRKAFEGCDIKIVPIMVGAISTQKEDRFGRLLAPYLKDPHNFFVVSSDFCHWGARFSYTFYRPSPGAPSTSLTARSERSVYADTPIHQSIRSLDNEGMMAITHPHTATSAAGAKTAKESRDAFASYIKSTKNTVCGRHPISVLLAALAELQGRGVKSECRFTRYEQSSQCLTPKDSSVSYASAFVRFL
ncbi:uncharacterized protein PFL1_05064 [Pseudozyma flocculosa PF-1]|uniref:Related to Protein MEMO1 n=2 Tax=Pseudozyma flocculosa TaxID=84751 RepID=A0A5C3EY39_9BASI|nr:uncharacterized protein PFL1_05064 [Pseudozyma flocculosa PF-1]EPQ27526.1 hypothetical protein PFL1_05064 [Pseudozyma flocculosa PF-1]SPO36039.1 related to Protein MEMO1 [Pseudozyma flocculosa]